MTTWILPVNADQHASYYYNVDGAFETLKTIFWGQSNAITNIAVDDIVYIYKSAPVQAIVWKCKVLDVNVLLKDVDIDDSAFEYGIRKAPDFCIKLTALCKYYGEARDKLSYAELRKNGLNTTMQGSLRASAQLLTYINSVV